MRKQGLVVVGIGLLVIGMLALVSNFAARFLFFRVEHPAIADSNTYATASRLLGVAEMQLAACVLAVLAVVTGTVLILKFYGRS